MENPRLHATLRELREMRGDQQRRLLIGDEQILLAGLEPTVCELLALRWGGFLSGDTGESPRLTLRFFRGGTGGWLERRSGERYRVEAIDDAAHRVVVSYNFAICADENPGEWRVALKDDPDEPIDRLLDNVARYFVARLAIQRGGFALHAAGLLKDGQAYLLAGPSRAGKSTAVSMVGEAISLGDDMALTWPGTAGWVVPALPFDNSERIVLEPPAGLFPLAGIWRLHQASQTRIEQPASSLAVASLMACAAFPWALPDLADPLLGQVKQAIDDRRFAHLHFSKDADFWSHLAARA